MDKKTKTIFLTVVVSVVIFVAIIYLLFVLIPQKHQERERVLQQARLQTCLGQAQQQYASSWNSYCLAEGRPLNCTFIGTFWSGNLEATKTQADQTCFQEYPQN